MKFLQHIEYEFAYKSQVDSLITHLNNTTPDAEGVTFKDIYFLSGKKKFILFLECESEEEYFDWREMCPPPPGANDWHEIFLTKDEKFPEC